MLQKSTREKVLEIFFLEPSKKHYLKEISKKIKIAHTSVKKVLNELLEEKIIIEKIERKGKRNFPLFYSNLEIDNFKNLKKFNNFKEIYDSKLIEYLEEKFMPKSIVLFGSYFRGEDIEESDIDLFIEVEELEVYLKKFEKKLGRKIN
ncbi:MAG: nucleotidyltransferase domain-containing protein, partial [Nanoarchaeota archaeon]|nr:nucleotidyltransferase domain-containing protein [Nanoarchaeota archaeon]